MNSSSLLFVGFRWLAAGLCLLMGASCGSAPAPSPPTPLYACSRVEHLSPDSPDARRIVQELIDNYQQDFPTEYLAVEELWAVDRLGEYAVLQARVTPEENRVMVAHQTEGGAVLAAAYILQVTGRDPSEIPAYLAHQLPAAPPELFYCLDLSRFAVS